MNPPTDVTRVMDLADWMSLPDDPAAWTPNERGAFVIAALEQAQALIDDAAAVKVEADAAREAHRDLHERFLWLHAGVTALHDAVEHQLARLNEEHR